MTKFEVADEGEGLGHGYVAKGFEAVILQGVRFWLVMDKRNREQEEKGEASYIISARGRPGWMYPNTNSVNTFRPIWLLVTAWMIPMGREKAKEMKTARRKAHHVRLVCQPRTVKKPRASI